MFSNLKLLQNLKAHKSILSKDLGCPFDVPEAHY